jgi:hypothetical protein
MKEIACNKMNMKNNEKRYLYAEPKCAQLTLNSET